MTLSKKYDELMEHVVVTSEMRRRIFDNVREDVAKPRAKIVKFPHWKKYAAAGFVIVLSGVLSVSALLHSSPKNLPADMQGTDGIVECQSAAALSKEVGFPISDIMVLPFKPTDTTYICSFGEIAEIDYTGADGQSAVYRKSLGKDDNSGIYDAFPVTTKISTGSIDAIMKGDGTVFTLAVWTDGRYSYSLYLSEGLSINDWSSIISSISEYEKAASGENCKHIFQKTDDEKSAT